MLTLSEPISHILRPDVPISTLIINPVFTIHILTSVFSYCIRYTFVLRVTIFLQVIFLRFCAVVHFAGSYYSLLLSWCSV